LHLVIREPELGGKMVRWKVTGTEKGRDGTIVGVSGPSLGYRSVREVIADLQSGKHQYYVREGPHESEVRVVGEGDDLRIQTTHDILSPNHLENLPPHRRWFRSRS
jgi:hypothetical protein